MKTHSRWYNRHRWSTLCVSKDCKLKEQGNSTCSQAAALSIRSPLSEEMGQRHCSFAAGVSVNPRTTLIFLANSFKAKQTRLYLDHISWHIPREDENMTQVCTGMFNSSFADTWKNSRKKNNSFSWMRKCIQPRWNISHCCKWNEEPSKESSCREAGVRVRKY